MKVKATDNLFKVRAEQALTIKELSVMAGVPTATISRAENGSTLSAKSAGKLCAALHRPFETLFTIED
jgi:transcriptional regulator with XRE-family HTH domain